MRKTVVAAAKWIWLAGVVAAAALVMVRSWDDIVRMLAGLSPTLLGASLLLTALAKLFLAENARIAAVRCGIPLRYFTAARLYNLSQLGKYLPGSIWQFVGRAAAYRNLGASYPQIRDCLLTESLWIVAGAALTGVLLTGPEIVEIVTGSLTPLLAWWLGGLVALVALVAAIFAIYRRATLMGYAKLAIPPWRAVLAQAMIWILLGGAFWVLLVASGLEAGLLFSIGLFGAAYAVGFMVPFAPAGLGVRDGILALGLLPFAPMAEALAITLLARVVYLVIDLALALIPEAGLLLGGRRSRP
ncbi:MAG: YbhN family protein [Xanthomonadales bacterium]|nr:YbhN family protein [Xanthomonadales bacterium]